MIRNRKTFAKRADVPLGGKLPRTCVIPPQLYVGDRETLELKLEEQALTLAVIAAVRHNHTNYDELLANGVDRATARQQMAARVEAVTEQWRR